MNVPSNWSCFIDLQLILFGQVYDGTPLGALLHHLIWAIGWPGIIMFTVFIDAESFEAAFKSLLDILGRGSWR